MSGSVVGGGKGKSKGKTRVQIPAFLQSFLEQSAGTAGNALSDLQSSINGGIAGNALVAPFSPVQQAAQALAVDRALNSGLFQNAYGTASNLAASGGADTSNLEGLAALGLDPTAIDTLRGQATAGTLPGMGTLRALSGEKMPSVSALTATANGDYLYGGPGFDQAVQAAVRSATPGILSTFGGAGAGGATGGLAQSAIGQAAVDAFARQYGQERQNQIGAANTLAGLSFQNRAQRANAADALGRLQLALNGQNIGAASELNNNALQTALGLAGIQQGNAGLQLQAANSIPGLAGADISLLGGVGDQQQQQLQRFLDAPRNAQLQLLQAALGGLPISSLLGSNSKSKQSQFGLQIGGGG